MQRRDFLKRTIQASAAVPLLSSGLMAKPVGHLFMPRQSAAGDRVLVLINLSGGNDGLNTLVPFNDSVYYNSRPDIAQSKGSLLQITSDLGLHGSMTEMRDLYTSGKAAIVQSVGYPNQDRSHFRSTDIWNSSSDAATILYTGWLGRYLSKIHPEYPGTLPSAPFAIQISSATNLALQSDKGSMGTAIDNPDRFYNLSKNLGGAENSPLPTTLAGPELGFIREIIAQSDEYAKSVNDAMIAGSNGAVYATDSLSAQLRVVARLINGGLTTGIYIVSLGGFDTHFGQMAPHATLLSSLSKAIKSFLDDMTAAGNGDRVVCMTYSEFGRRLNQNGSLGTDHGAASLQFVCGKPVIGNQVIGGAPDLVNLDERGDVKFKNDYRQIYSSVLQDWMGFSKTDTSTVLGGDFSKLPLFAGSGVRDEESARMAGYVLGQNSPNPANGSTTIDFAVPQTGFVQLSVLTTDGRLALPVIARTLEAGPHRVPVNTSRLANGTYTYVLESNGYRVSRRMVVVK